MRGKCLSDDLVRAIYMKRDRGLFLRAIANTLEVSLGAVQNVLKRRVSNQLEQKKAKLGPRRITNAITDAKIGLR
jgi:DNA-directed RNA polymerase specialized sigma24 family protein